MAATSGARDPTSRVAREDRLLRRTRPSPAMRKRQRVDCRVASPTFSSPQDCLEPAAWRPPAVRSWWSDEPAVLLHQGQGGPPAAEAPGVSGVGEGEGD